MMTYIEMLPIVAKLLSAPDSMPMRERAELLAQLPDPDTVPFRSLLESAARLFAALEPIEVQVRALELEEEALFAKRELLAAQKSVKWGPKKLPTGESELTISVALEKVQTSLDSLTPSLLSLRESLSPLVAQMRGLDLFFADQEDLKEWEARGLSDPLPDCITDMLRREQEEFLGDAVAVAVATAAKGRGQK